MELNGQLHVPLALTPGKIHWCLLYKRLGGPPTRIGGCGEEKNLCQESKPDFSEVQAVAQSLYQLSYFKL
jgi:hypothetical protein